MPFSLKPIQNLSLTKLQIFLCFIATIIATIILYHKHGVTDPDSVLYLEAARLFSLGQWLDGYHIYPWPFYSVCIAAVHKISSLSIHNSATFLNVIFFVIATFSFLKIIELCGGKKLDIWIGALILFSSNQIVGNILGILMRDVGFWAFLLSALVFFMQFFKSHSYKDAFFWQASIIIATLFRIEGIGFLLLLPISLFTFKKNEALQNICAYIKANFLNLGLLFCICTIALISNPISINDLGRLNEVFSISAYQEFTSKLTTNAKIMSSQVLGKFLDDYATQGLLLTFAYAIFWEMIKTTGRLTSVLGLLGIRTKEILMDNAMRKILYFSAGIASLNLAIITIKAFIITQRYILAFSFIWMVFATFYLAHLCKSFNQQKQTPKKILAVGIILFLCFSLGKHLLPNSKDTFIQQEAVAWLKIHNISNAPVFYDESRARYYANAPFMGKFNRYNKIIEKYINDQSIFNYQYLLITFSKDYAVYEDFVRKSTPEFVEVKRFCQKDDAVCSVVFMKIDPSNKLSN